MSGVQPVPTPLYSWAASDVYKRQAYAGVAGSLSAVVVHFVAPDSFTAKIPRFASVSPDGRTVVFESLGSSMQSRLQGALRGG